MISKEQEETAKRRAELEKIRIIEAEWAKELEMKEERRKKKELKRQQEEARRLADAEEKAKNEDMNLGNLFGSPGRTDKNQSITKLLR